MRRAANLTTYIMPIVLKSGILNPLEPSGPVQACNGSALPLTDYTVSRLSRPVSLNTHDQTCLKFFFLLRRVF